MATAAAVNELGSYAHNPRGNLWFKGDSYGKNLLFKMGWREGKGLGKKEDGIKENLKVKLKNTNSGLGYTDVSYANVMKTEYESILKSLKPEYSEEKTVNGCNKSLKHENNDFKQRSRVVKSKIRYPKLYYGKDVSKYSEEDMKSIFICSLPAQDNGEKKAEDSEICFENKSENQLPTVQETFTSHISVSDYFNLKMKEKKSNEQRSKCSGKVKLETDSDCNKGDYKIKQEKTDFESGKTNNEKEREKYEFWSNKISYKMDQEKIVPYHITENLVPQPIRKKCKKQKIKAEVSMNGVDKDLSVVQTETEVTPHKKHKKSSENSVHEKDFSEDKMYKLSNFVGEKCASSKKRKKAHKKENHNICMGIEAVSSYQSDIHSELVPSKKRKKLNEKEKDEVSANTVQGNNISTAGLMEINGESLSDINNNNSAKKKKKMKNKFNSLKKLKSCLKSKSNMYAVKNVSFNENTSYRMIESDSESIGISFDSEDKLQKDFKISTSDISLEKNSADSEDKEAEDPSEQNGTLHSDPLAISPDEDKCISLSSLPSSNSSHYNSWVENQKVALKMKIYKNILKGIKKHDILKTTNLLFIKGYGSWGFE